MKIVADTHLHFYPCYDTGRALALLFRNLAALADGGGPRLGFLAERQDCHFHADLLKGRVPAVPGFAFQVCEDGQGVRVVSAGATAGELYLLPGRQIVTRERLEILALAADEPVPNGLPAAEVVQRTLGNGGVPVLAWAPGKWFFRRGETVRDLLDAFDPGTLAIGDTSLRPTLWAEPRRMRAARQRGFRVLAGSDPLPFRGEEVRMGTYAAGLEGDFDASRAVASARALLLGPARSLGRRGGPLTVLRRLWKNARSAHSSPS